MSWDTIQVAFIHRWYDYVELMLYKDDTHETDEKHFIMTIMEGRVGEDK